ncbi:hypothetical protein MNQ98_18435 [Paenibacillus sp. N3/727]|uniref:HAAS signaling domain-containing protein n=1 Tax=Paenibacillus sp. N3/727 TaxID=2925845 RepID=UPI001F52C810|nr:hypothetical protein [Paenibacillus sp. N3/727]UNK16475.1 hypothetical protein MNQ98_18435 [Paenibacillus sp. N3/727]
MELIKKYVYAVTQKLPAQQRSEIEKELTGLIEDMLEERTQGGPVQESDVEEVLIELGDPSVLADKYRGKARYLISPERFNPYLAVLKIVMFSVVIAMSVGFVIEFFMGPVNIAKHFAEYLASLFSAIFQGFAWVTIVFALLDLRGDRTSDNRAGAKKTWKLSDLPSIPDSKTVIKPIEPILGIIFSIVFLVLFTYSLNLVGVHLFRDGQSTVIPVFNEEVFRKYIPFIWVLTAIGVLRDCMKMITRKWTRQIVVFHLFFNVISLIFVLVMFSDPSIWNPQFMNELIQAGVTTEGIESFQTISTIWDRSREGLIYIIALITVIDSIATGMKLSRIK